MPFRLNEWRAKIQFTTSAEMPELIYQACLATGTVSGTVYCQRALCEALARDLGLNLDDLLAALPPPRGSASYLFEQQGRRHRNAPVRTGPANTVEEVR